MAACESIQHIFENPIPDNPNLIESLPSWKQIKPEIHTNNSSDNISLDQHQQNQQTQSSFAEIFGEIRFEDNPGGTLFAASSSTSSSSSTMIESNAETQNPGSSTKPAGFLDEGDGNNKRILVPATSSCPASPRTNYSPCHRKSSESGSSMSSESLQLCTEGLGFESFDDVDDLKLETDDDGGQSKEENGVMRQARNNSYSLKKQPIEYRRSKSCLGAFPPPISSIGTSGKPWVCFKSYRENGRFVLKEVRIPTKEYLRASREDGRLKLHFVEPDDEFQDEADQDEDDGKDEGILNEEEEDGNETSRVEASGDS